ncbi:MAG: hypothetical protein V1817_02075 [Candidatus Micrarchaeota archaeon]
MNHYKQIFNVFKKFTPTRKIASLDLEVPSVIPEPFLSWEAKGTKLFNVKATYNISVRQNHLREGKNFVAFVAALKKIKGLQNFSNTAQSDRLELSFEHKIENPPDVGGVGGPERVTRYLRHALGIPSIIG